MTQARINTHMAPGRDLTMKVPFKFFDVGGTTVKRSANITAAGDGVSATEGAGEGVGLGVGVDRGVPFGVGTAVGVASRMVAEGID